MKYPNIKEEELKLKVSRDYFSDFDCTRIIGNIDYCVSTDYSKFDNSLFKETTDDWRESLLWAEAKKGIADVYNSFTQLILTIGKARTFDKSLPPPFLGVMDSEKMAFIHWSAIHELFYVNDFNWNVTPSDYKTKEFAMVLDRVKNILANDYLLFDFEKDEKELKSFIKTNFKHGNENPSKIKITKNNFMIIYNKWLQTVKPTISIDWNKAKANGIIDGDFYLADILSRENESIKEKLFVLLKKDYYELDKRIDAQGLFDSKKATFNDKQKAHTLFWSKYERPPKEEYWDYIIGRRDLLVPQDVRERKGSYFTPQVWVELSQKYLADTLGENWQDEYYVWDCAAGTGNLLNGLTNKYNIWASTLDQQDVDVMKDRIKNGANLLESHVFQFDFLNDDFSKLPIELQKIINDEEKRKKLVMYINPPYAEADSRKGKGRTGVAETLIHKKYSNKMGYSKRELYIQFLTRIYFEIKGCVLADFSTLKNIQAPKFIDFRNYFRAALTKCFIVPAKTFDNVKGEFPIGFKIWKTSVNEIYTSFESAVYNDKCEYLGTKTLWAYDQYSVINNWVKTFRYGDADSIATIIGVGNDFQNQRLVRIDRPNMKVPADNHNWQITHENLIPSSVYFSVRHCIAASWLNDRDQFLYPHGAWEADEQFQTNCLVFALFNNNIQSKHCINHWIPFTEQEVDAKEKFESHFMSDFIGGKNMNKSPVGLFDEVREERKELQFSLEAKTVLNAGLILWKYYHSQENINVNASLYDIREYFQGRDGSGKMNNKSNDEHYSELIGNLRSSLKLLANKIEPKVYEYGFLKP